MSTTTPADMPTALLQAATVELVDELLRRGIGLDEVCQHLGVSRDELGHLVGKDAVDQRAALNA